MPLQYLLEPSLLHIHIFITTNKNSITLLTVGHILKVLFRSDNFMQKDHTVIKEKSISSSVKSHVNQLFLFKCNSCSFYSLW